MNAHITEMIKNCYECQVHGNRNTGEPLRLHEIPNRPWQKVGMDLFTHDGKIYLVLVDYSSGYPELIQLLSTTSTAVITSMKAMELWSAGVVMSDHSIVQRSLKSLLWIGNSSIKHQTLITHNQMVCLKAQLRL